MAVQAENKHVATLPYLFFTSIIHLLLLLSLSGPTFYPTYYSFLCTPPPVSSFLLPPPPPSSSSSSTLLLVYSLFLHIFLTSYSFYFLYFFSSSYTLLFCSLVVYQYLYFLLSPYLTYSHSVLLLLSSSSYKI